MDFTKFFNSPDKNIVKATKILEAARQQLDMKAISTEQFYEISQEVLQVAETSETSNDSETKLRIQDTINTIKKIIGDLII